MIYFFKKFQCQVDGLCTQISTFKVYQDRVFFLFVLGDEPINELYHQKIKNIKVVGP